VIFAVSTVKDTVPNVEKFVRRNLAGGVDHLIVFLDDEQPEVEAFLAASPNVTCLATHRDWWHGERQAELNDRQRTHATLAAQTLSRFAWAHWMFHIDGDEVVHIDRTALAALGDDVRAVRLSPLEAVAEFRADSDPTWFKPLLDQEQLVRLADLGVIARPNNRAFFRGHITGKVGVRPSSDMRVAIHTAGSTTAGSSSLPTVVDPAYTMLHYESPNGDQFVRKWRSLLASGGSVGQRTVRRRFGGEIKRLLALDLSAEETAALLEHLYQEHVADDVETLRRLGLLQHRDPDSWVHEPEPIPRSEAGAWAEALAHMRRAPKSAYLPPTRRNAPLAPGRAGTGSE
jgi:hypothetical protein